MGDARGHSEGLIFQFTEPCKIKKAAGEGTGCLTEGSNKGFSFTLGHILLMNSEENMKIGLETFFVITG